MWGGNGREIHSENAGSRLATWEIKVGKLRNPSMFSGNDCFGMAMCI